MKGTHTLRTTSDNGVHVCLSSVLTKSFCTLMCSAHVCFTFFYCWFVMAYARLIRCGFFWINCSRQSALTRGLLVHVSFSLYQFIIWTSSSSSPCYFRFAGLSFLNERMCDQIQHGECQANWCIRHKCLRLMFSHNEQTNKQTNHLTTSKMKMEFKAETPGTTQLRNICTVRSTGGTLKWAPFILLAS